MPEPRHQAVQIGKAVLRIPLHWLLQPCTKLCVLSGERDDVFYRRIMSVLSGLGIPIMPFSAWNLHAHQWAFLWMFRIGTPRITSAVFSSRSVTSGW